MKAIICTKYGAPDVLELREVKKPIPKDNELLIKVHVTTATAADSMMRRADPFICRFFLGFMRPKNAITGTGFSGEIEAVGRNAKSFQVGDQVFGESGINFSANAQYVCVSEDGVLAIKPDYISHEKAATICDGVMTSFNFLKNIVEIKAGQKILINGASGSLGTAAVQIASHFGADVTGVCSSRNVDLVKSIGASKVIDYKKEDFTQARNSYDVIFDTIGKSSFGSCKDSLTKKGCYLSPVLGMNLLLKMLWTSKFTHKKAKFSATGLMPALELRNFLKEIVKLVKDGKIDPIIDRSYKLENTSEAHEYVDTGHKKGNVVIVVE